MPGELDDAPGATMRFLYLGLTRSSNDAGFVLWFFVNHASSTLTHTDAVSIGDSCPLPWPSGSSYFDADAGAPFGLYGSRTSFVVTREANVLSMPNTTSPSGLFLLSTSLFASSPASPDFTTLTV